MTLPGTSLEGLRALVCGASRGIGRAAAEALATAGARVTGLARGRPQGALPFPLVAADLDDRPALARVVDRLLAEGGPFHVLVNNAGGPPAGPILEAGEQDFLAAFGRHVLASHHLVRSLLPGMREAGYGRIVNVVSTSVREPIPGLGVSNTIRGAMAAWAKTVSRELPPGVTINNVLPGYTDTERLSELREALARRTGQSPEQVQAGWLAPVPEGRLGRPAELGAVVAFLASPAAAFIRGASLPVDGGRLASV
ncbi:MAG: SDR family oxidoreductase [Planctomycetes bacterium]|nr:SDR family oxidoreductase [Planctomycetota bacterium]